MEIGIQWPLALFTLIAGAGCGLLATTGFALFGTNQSKETRKITLIVVLILLAVGGLLSVFHLEHPERFMAAIANLLSFSGIALELIGLALCGVTAILLLVFSASDNRMGQKVMAVCSIVFGTVAAFLHGYAYFEVTAQPGWHVLALALGYLLTSLASGSLLYVAIATFRSEDAAELLPVGKVSAALTALALVAVVAYVVSLGTAGLLTAEAGMLAGAAIVSGLAALVLALWFAFKKPSIAVAIAGVVCALGTGLFIRILMWAVASSGMNFILEAMANRGLYLF